MTQLGEPWTAPDGLPYDHGVLFLADTKVYGSAGPLRSALPALDGWGPARDVFDYTPCSRIGYPGLNTCSGLGLPMVTDAPEVVGVDECACCTGSTRRRDSVTGACVRAVPTATLEPESKPAPEPTADSSPAVVSDRALAVVVGLGLLAAMLCGVVCCRQQEREGLFERLLAKVTKGDTKYDTSEVKLSAPGVARSDVDAAP